MWKKCDHCKKYHELYLNYNSENNSSLWVDIMEKKLKWNKQQNLDDENQETTHCYDLSLRQGRFAGNVCQSLRLAVWANVPWNVGNVQLTKNVGNVPDVSDVPNVHLIYIYIVTSQIDSFSL